MKKNIDGIKSRKKIKKENDFSTKDFRRDIQNIQKASAEGIKKKTQDTFVLKQKSLGEASQEGDSSNFKKKPYEPKVKKDLPTGKYVRKTFVKKSGSYFFVKSKFLLGKICLFLYQKRKWLVLLFSLFLVSIFLMSSSHHAILEYSPKRKFISFDKRVSLFSRPSSFKNMYHEVSVNHKSSTSLLLESFKEKEFHSYVKVRVFNSYSSQPQKLIAGTRFEALSGNIFLLEEEIILPGMSNGQVKSIDITLRSDLAGPGQNIDFTDFSLPAFREQGLDRKYDGIYAMSLERAKGGRIEKEYYINENQLSLAQSQLKEANYDALVERVHKELDGRFIIPEGSSSIKYFPLDINIAKNNADISQSVAMTFPLVKKEDLYSLIKESYGGSKNLSIESPEGIIVTSVSQNNNELVLDVFYEGDLVSGFDKDDLKSLLGIHVSDFSMELDKLSLFDEARLRIKPFWKKRIPDSFDELIIKER